MSFLNQRVYVGNLPFSARQEDVEQLFAEFGEVISVALPNDRETGRPRGFGFVEMSKDDATAAIKALDGKDFDGRNLRVNEAEPREERRGGGGGRKERRALCGEYQRAIRIQRDRRDGTVSQGHDLASCRVSGTRDLGDLL